LPLALYDNRVAFRSNRSSEENIGHLSGISLTKATVYFHQVSAVVAMNQHTAKKRASNLVNFCDLNENPLVGVSLLDFCDGKHFPKFRFHTFKSYTTISSKARQLCE
jgi:hypothetical protein